MASFMYSAINEAPVFDSVTNDKGQRKINAIMLGTYVRILETQGNWHKVSTSGPDGWMHKSSLADEMGLKVFFLDVGQGDGMLIEVGNLRILIDGGPDSSMYNYLTKWQYSYLINNNEKIHIDYLIVSHFDTDHYTGFTKIIDDSRFTFGTICHAGILKFAGRTNPHNTGLGNRVEVDGKKYLTQIFENLLTADRTVPFNRDLNPFMDALQKAYLEGRIAGQKRCVAGDVLIDQLIEGKTFKIDVLGPFTETVNHAPAFVYWTDDGKTINGHSIVLKLTFGTRTLLLGGDLNTSSEKYLMKKYNGNNVFRTDVAKSCHHGSADFTESFMELIQPFATVISSGDNEGHAHPRADAIGCAGKYSRGARPLVFSTELARSVNLLRNDILFGMINLRSNGTDIYFNQMKEEQDDTDMWDSYKV